MGRAEGVVLNRNQPASEETGGDEESPSRWKSLPGLLVLFVGGLGALMLAVHDIDSGLLGGGLTPAETYAVSTGAFVGLIGGLTFPALALAFVPTELFRVKDVRPYRRVQGIILYGGFALFLTVPWIATFAAEHVLERRGFVECPNYDAPVGRFFTSHWAKTPELCAHFNR